jgi:hypothetical protein
LNHPFALQFQNADEMDGTAVVTMKMLYSRPLPWAEGTDFDPHYDDANKITLQVDVRSEEDKKIYKTLLKWMVSNVPGECAKMGREDAKQLWNNVSKYVAQYCITPILYSSLCHTLGQPTRQN